MNRSNQFRNLSRQAEDASMEGMMSNRSIAGRESLMTSVVKAASVFNNILIENCGLCTVYCDKQVQYEDYVQQQYDVSTGAMGHLYAQLNPAAATSMPAGTAVQASTMEQRNVANNVNFGNPTNEVNTPPNNTMKSPTMSSNDPRIQNYREFLFDEESVVRSVGSRGARDDEE